MNRTIQAVNRTIRAATWASQRRRVPWVPRHPRGNSAPDHTAPTTSEWPSRRRRASWPPPPPPPDTMPAAPSLGSAIDQTPWATAVNLDKLNKPMALRYLGTSRRYPWKTSGDSASMRRTSATMMPGTAMAVRANVHEAKELKQLPHDSVLAHHDSAQGSKSRRVGRQVQIGHARPSIQPTPTVSTMPMPATGT